MQKESGEIHIDGGFNRKEPQEFKEVVLRAIEKCRIEGSKEMTKGGEITQLIEGQPVVVTIPNQRKIFMESVETLYDLLYFYFDKEVKDNTDKYMEAIEDIYGEYLEKYIQTEQDPMLSQIARTTELIPGESSLREPMIQAMDDFKLRCWRIIFRELILLYKRKKELSKKRIIED